MIKIQQIEYQTKGKRKLTLDNGEIWELYRGDLTKYELAEDMVLPPELYEEIRQEVIGKRVKKRALFLLEKMDRTEYQLRTKLKENGYPQDLIEDAMEYVKGYHYLDDERYARTYIQYHQESKSKQMLKMDLMKKGIKRELLETVMEEEFQGEESEMIQALLKKKHYNDKEATPEEKRRVFQYLMRRGFRGGDIQKEMRIMNEEG